MTYKENQILLGHHPDAGYPIILEIVRETMYGNYICNFYNPDFNSWTKNSILEYESIKWWIKDTRAILISKQKKDFFICLWTSK